jgi:hypothetical protein
MKNLKLPLVILVLAFAVETHAQSVATLFSSTDPIAVKLEAPLTTLFNQKGEANAKDMHIEGKLTFQSTVIPVKIRLRGFSSLTNCDFPKMTLELDNKAIVGTVFDHNDKLDLGTHCYANGDPTNWLWGMHFPYREALIYRWLGILGITSYSSRNAVVTYVDTAGNNTPNVQMAFLLENLDTVLAQLQASEIRNATDVPKVKSTTKPSSSDANPPQYIFTSIEASPKFDSDALSKIDLFEHLIANYDWHLTGGLWNMKVVQLKDGTWLPIPMDFNLATITWDNSYPQPGMNYFPVATAAVRLKIIADFEARKDALYASLQDLGEDASGKARMKAALDQEFLSMDTFNQTALADAAAAAAAAKQTPATP